MRPGRRFGGVLANVDFRRLWAAQTISVYGTQVTILAVPIVAALTLHVSPFEFGLLGTLEFLPFVLLGLPAGVWVDRLRRRPILITADLLRAVTLLSIPIAVVLDRLTIWQLFAVVFANGCLTVFFDVAYQSYLPSIVEGPDLVEGNAKLEFTRRTSQRLGPGIGGILIGLLTAPFAMVIDAASYALSALFISQIRRREGPARPIGEGSEPGVRSSMRSEIMIGLRFVVGHQWLAPLALSVALGNLFGYIVDSILILHLVRERGLGAAEIGLAFTVGSIGVVGGAILTSRLTRRHGIGRMLLFAALGEGVSWLPIAVAPDGLVFAGLATTITALGFFSAFWTINAISLRQAVTPPRMMGRATATMRFISWGAIPIGTTIGGFLGGAIGLHNTIWVGAVGALAAFLPVALSPLRIIRELPEPAPAPVSAP